MSLQAQPFMERILGVPVHAVSLSDAVAYVEERARCRDSRCEFLVCANANSVIAAQTNAALARAFERAALVIPDGGCIAMASRLGGGRVRHKVAGPDVFEQVGARQSNAPRLRLFLLGATERTLTTLVRRIERDKHGATVVGTYAPPLWPWDSEEDRRIIDVIDAADPDVLCVGFGAPNQEIWLERNRKRLSVSIALAIGAAFDFYGGRKRRPKTLVRLRLFWLYRAVVEPRRWRRYVGAAVKFTWLVFRGMIFANQPPAVVSKAQRARDEP